MLKRSTTILAYALLVSLLSACSLFGSSKDNNDIPPGTSNVLGFVQWIDEVPVEEVDVELAGQTVTTGEEGLFAFDDIDNGRYTLNVIRDDKIIHELPVVLRGDVADLIVRIGENVYQWGSFEEVSLGALPPSGVNEIWAVNDSSAETAVVNDVARTGNKSVRVYGKKDGDNITVGGTVRQYGRDLVGNATYRLTAWFKTDKEVQNAQDEPIFMRLRFYVENTSTNIGIRDNIEQMMLSPTSDYYRMNGPNLLMIFPEEFDDEWNKISAEFIAPENTDRLLMELFHAKVWHEDGESTIWWDDVTLVRID